jgi:hypothetical protein
LPLIELTTIFLQMGFALPFKTSKQWALRNES